MNSAGRISKYEILKRLNVGGMAEIFLARQTGVHGFEKMVVIKRILPHLAEQQRFVQMFLDEARLAARFNHPNIVQIYDLGQDGDVFFIAMEFVHGEDVKAIVRRCAKLKRRIPTEHVVKIFTGVLDGLHFAHTQSDLDGRLQGVVHRDVSPHNILVTFQGGVKLVDFGIAKARSQISTTIPGRIIGKHAYMSPEQCLGVELDGRSDIFSAGIVMYELVTWTRLFRRGNDSETFKAITSGEIKPPRSYRPELNEELERIILKALARDREQRYRTAREMQVSLEEYLVNQGLKSNTVLIAQFMSELFTDKLAAMENALKRANVKDLEGAVLTSPERQPDLVAFLNMFFNGARSGNKYTDGGGDWKGSKRFRGRETTPGNNTTHQTEEANHIPVKTTSEVTSTTGKAAPTKATPPKAPDGMKVRYVAPRDKKAVTQSLSPTRPEASEHLPGVPEAYNEELIPSSKKGRSFAVTVTITLAALAGGLIYKFHASQRASNVPITGLIRVKSVPSNADVSFNGILLPSRTPTEVDRVEPNQEHFLKVSLPTYSSWEKKFLLRDTTKPLEFTAILGRESAPKMPLSGLPITAETEGQGKGEILVVSTPSDARIYLDGVFTGQRSPCNLRNVPTGRDHVVLLEKKGLNIAFERISLKEGQKSKVDLVLEKGGPSLTERIAVRVESEPEGATVIVNGYPLRNPTNMTVGLLASEPSKIEVELKGYYTWKHTVRPVPGVKLTLFARMRKR